MSKLKRICITIDEDLLARCRTLQAKMIKESKQAVSFSACIQILIEEGLKH